MDTTNDTKTNPFLEEVQILFTFKMANYIALYWFPILAPIGLIGNTLSFFVMIKPNNRKMSTCIYMAAISINDNLMMCLALYSWMVTGIKVYEIHPFECEFAGYWNFIQMQNGTYQVIAMTIDKYIAIKWPHKAATYSTAKRAKITVFGILICVFIYNIPHIFISRKVGAQCIGYVVGGTFTIIYSWLSFTLNGIIPFVSLIYMNYFIVKLVRSSHKMFGGTESQCGLKGQGQIRQNKMKITENQLTIMLLLVTTLFLILMTPAYVRYVYTQFANIDTPGKYAGFVFYFHLSQKLYLTNNGINFFLYCISGKKFRNDLKELLCCGRGLHGGRNASQITDHGSITDRTTLS